MFSYLSLSDMQRHFLVAFATSGSVADTLRAMVNPRTKELGMGEKTFYLWKKEPAFAEALENIKTDPEWAHKHIWRPWMLALDDLLILQRATGLKTVNGKEWTGLSDKKREQLLQEHDMLTRNDDKEDTFTKFMKDVFKQRLAQPDPVPQISVIDLALKETESHG